MHGESVGEQLLLQTEQTHYVISHFRNFHGNNPQTIWTHFPCWWLVLVSAGIQRHKNCEIHSQVLQPVCLMAPLQALIIRVKKSYWKWKQLRHNLFFFYTNSNYRVFWVLGSTCLHDDTYFQLTPPLPLPKKKLLLLLLFNLHERSLHGFRDHEWSVWGT